MNMGLFLANMTLQNTVRQAQQINMMNNHNKKKKEEEEKKKHKPKHMKEEDLENYFGEEEIDPNLLSI